MKTTTSDITGAKITAGAVILAAIITATGALWAGWFQKSDPKPTTSVPSTSTTLATKLAGDLTIEYPRHEGTELVGSCQITASGSGTVPTGKALVVAAKADRDPRLWFEGTVTGIPNVRIGRPISV